MVLTGWVVRNNVRLNQVQGSLDFRQHGGARPGAGRKRSPKSGVEHRRRVSVPKNSAAHVTIRTVRAVGNLRTKRRFHVVKSALSDGAERFGCRLVHFSVQKNHLHLIVEPRDRRALSRAMKGLQVRIARRLNKYLGRRGTVFADRYHAHLLCTPRETRNALAYVLLNARKHARQVGVTLPKRWRDPYSSARWFDGFDVPTRPPPDRIGVAAESWLLTQGWRRQGPISISEVPGASDQKTKTRKTS